jgi:hypothetical protein
MCACSDFLLVDAFFAAHHEARARAMRTSGYRGPSRAVCFLATDDASYAAQLVRRYGKQMVVQVGDAAAEGGARPVLRAAGREAVWNSSAWGNASAKPWDAGRRLGAEVIRDTLLLAKCDFLIKSASHVSEFAIYYNPILIERTIDLGIGGPRRLPAWAAALGWANLTRWAEEGVEPGQQPASTERDATASAGVASHGGGGAHGGGVHHRTSYRRGGPRDSAP